MSASQPGSDAGTRPRVDARRARALLALTAANVALFACHLTGLWAFANWATRLVPWFVPLFVLGPPVALAAMLVSWIRPRSIAVRVLNLGLFALYCWIWIPLAPGLQCVAPG